MNFKAVEPEDRKTAKIVDTVISNAVNEDKLNDNITVKKVAVPKEPAKPVINIIKTTNVTAPAKSEKEEGGK